MHVTRMAGLFRDVSHGVPRMYFKTTLGDTQTIVRLYLDEQYSGFPNEETGFDISDLPKVMSYPQSPSLGEL